MKKLLLSFGRNFYEISYNVFKTPAGDAAMSLKKHFATVLICSSIFLGFSVSMFAQTQKGIDIDGEAINDWSGHSVSMPDVNTMAIGAPYNDGNGNNAGQVRIYSWNGSAWVQKGMDLNGEAADDWSGYSVSMPDSNTVAIGAPNNDGNGNSAGHVRIYSWNGSAWIQKGIDIDGEAAGDWSGYSVSMPDSNTVAIGAPLNSSLTGHVRIYSWNGSGWAQKGLSMIGNILQWEAFGSAVSMPDANTVAIGAPETDLDWMGYVRIYTWNGVAWIQKGLVINGEEFAAYSGRSVSMPDANTVAIGAPGQGLSGSDAGYVRICSWNGSSWVQKGLDIFGEAANDESGYSVSMSDSNTIAIGSRANNGSGILAGHVRVFVWNNGSWVQNGNDIDGEAANDKSSWSVSMPDVQTVGIGAYLNDGNGSDAGHVRVYSICGTTNSINQSECTSYTSPSGNYTWTSSGTYMDIIPNEAGCDSVIIVNLTIGDNSSNINPNACFNYTSPSGNYIWTSSGTFIDTIPNFAGCDSVITVNLTIINDNFSSINPIVCNSYTSPSGNYIWTSSGTFIDTLPNFAGCDSVITVDLTINSLDISVTNSSPNLTANAIGSSYKWLDCNNAMAIISGAINQSYTPTTNGNYAVEVTQNGCVDTSECEVVDNLGIITNNYDYGVLVSPNPSKESFVLSFKHAAEGSYEIVDLAGRMYYCEELTGELIYTIHGLYSGVYFLRILYPSGVKEVIRVIVE